MCIPHTEILLAKPTRARGDAGYATDYPEEFGPDTWARLVGCADALRLLVRVKVADDNDLKTAHSGLQICTAFFEGLAELTRLRGAADEYDVYHELTLCA